MTTQPVAPRRRTFLIGKAKPTAVIGKNREPGEIFLLVLGGALGMVFGLVAPILPLKIIGLVGFPLLAFAAVFMPYRRRTFYKWFEINRSYKRMLRSSARNRYRSSTMEAGVKLDGRIVDVPAPPGVGALRWMSVPFGPDELTILMHLDRRTITAAIEIEGPGVGLRD
jgi:hypothetical protein